MKCLITGAAGFIGYHLANHLLANAGNQLVLVNSLQRGKVDDDFDSLLKNKRVKFVEADLTDWNFYKTLPADFDRVYHLAAVNRVRSFYEIPHEVLRVNTLSLIYILEWIRGLEKKPKFCFASSNEACVGALAAFNQLPIPTPENVPLVISDSYNPRWSYGGTKLIGELFVIHYAKAYNFPAVIVRPHNFYGPRAGEDNVIPEFCKKIIDRVEPFILYSPEEMRAFCYVKDGVEAIQLLMDSKSTDGQPVETVNIGNTDEVTMLDLVKKMFDVAGWTPKKLEFKPSSLGSVKRRLADISKIKKLVGWEPSTPLGNGLIATFNWYKDHPKK